MAEDWIFEIFVFCIIRSAPDCCLIRSFLFVCSIHSFDQAFSQKTYMYRKLHPAANGEKKLRCPNVANVGKGNTILAQLSIEIRSTAWFGCDSSMKIRFSVEDKSVCGFQCHLCFFSFLVTIFLWFKRNLRGRSRRLFRIAIFYISWSLHIHTHTHASTQTPHSHTQFTNRAYRHEYVYEITHDWNYNSFSFISWRTISAIFSLTLNRIGSNWFGCVCFYFVFLSFQLIDVSLIFSLLLLFTLENMVLFEGIAWNLIFLCFLFYFSLSLFLFSSA